MESYPGRDRAVVFAFAPQFYPQDPLPDPSQPTKNCHPEQSEGSAFPPAVAVLAVIPAGNLLVPSHTHPKNRHPDPSAAKPKDLR